METVKITSDDHRYPALLKKIPDYPKVLYCRGKIEVLRNTSITVVGTRKMSQYGINCTRRFFSQSEQLNGYSIVSGVARGIDNIVHKVGFRNGIPTIAVVVSFESDQDSILLDLIVQKGCVISENLMKKKIFTGDYPRRNRILAGMSCNTYIVEAPIHSGAMITARQALDYGREVYSFPGSVNSGLSDGCNKLISEGAGVVFDQQSFIDSLI
jgi:DNA processing protein